MTPRHHIILQQILLGLGVAGARFSQWLWRRHRAQAYRMRLALRADLNHVHKMHKISFYSKTWEICRCSAERNTDPKTIALPPNILYDGSWHYEVEIYGLANNES